MSPLELVPNLPSDDELGDVVDEEEEQVGVFDALEHVNLPIYQERTVVLRVHVDLESLKPHEYHDEGQVAEQFEPVVDYEQGHAFVAEEAV